jgi:hypothetical protein
MAAVDRKALEFSALVRERDYWHADAERLSAGLIAISNAPADALPSALRSVAYDVALNCMDAETATFQIRRRSEDFHEARMKLIDETEPK